MDLLFPRANALPQLIMAVIAAAGTAVLYQVYDYFQSVKNSKRGSKYAAGGLHARNRGFNIGYSLKCLDQGFDNPKNPGCRKMKVLWAQNSTGKPGKKVTALTNCSGRKPYTEYLEHDENTNTSHYFVVHYPKSESLPDEKNLEAGAHERTEDAKENIKVAQENKKAADRVTKKVQDGDKTEKAKVAVHSPLIVEYWVAKNGKLTEGNTFVTKTNPLNDRLDFFEKAYEVKFEKDVLIENVAVDYDSQLAYQRRLKTLLLHEDIKPYYIHSEAGIEGQRIQDGYQVYYQKITNVVNICNPETSLMTKLDEFEKIATKALEDEDAKIKEKSEKQVTVNEDNSAQ
jgi:hypothetical protein